MIPPLLSMAHAVATPIHSPEVEAQLATLLEG